MKTATRATVGLFVGTHGGRFYFHYSVKCQIRGDSDVFHSQGHTAVRIFRHFLSPPLLKHSHNFFRSYSIPGFSKQTLPCHWELEAARSLEQSAVLVAWLIDFIARPEALKDQPTGLLKSLLNNSKGWPPVASLVYELCGSIEAMGDTKQGSDFVGVTLLAKSSPNLQHRISLKSLPSVVNYQRRRSAQKRLDTRIERDVG